MFEPSFIDTETTGFHGVMVLMQAAIGDEEPKLWCPWIETAKDSLEFIEHYVLNPAGVVGFNWGFDMFHIQKMHSMLKLFAKKYGEYAFPEDYINEMADLEMEARYGDCIKPAKTLDLMLHARKGPFQSLMNRKDIRIRRIPRTLAEHLVITLNDRIVLDDIYFARKGDPTKRWTIIDIENVLGEVIPELVDVALKFAASASLKILAIHTGIQDKATRSVFEEIQLPKQYMSNELGWAPFAKAPFKLENGMYVNPTKANWRGRWPQYLTKHIEHWGYNEQARKYAADDIYDTRGLFRYFNNPDLGDDDSELASMVGGARWRGFAMDIPHLEAELKEAEQELTQYKFNWNSPPVCRKMLERNMSHTEKTIVQGTGKDVLNEVSKWKVEEVCDDCYGAGCDNCNLGMVASEESHPAAADARLILEARRASKRKGDLVKLLMVDMFHPDFKVIGTKSSRMSGTGGLNAQGINSGSTIRKGFTLACEGEILDGGDFDAFEITIMDAEYNDPALRADLESGKKIHAVMGSFLYDMTYDEVMATSDLPGDENKYGLGKSSIFALAYGGDEGTLSRRSGVSEEKARLAYNQFTDKYRGMGEGRQVVIEDHTCMVQKGGLGSKIEWEEPADYVESMFGFKRFFTLENEICKQLFDLANDPPKEWNNINEKIVRRDRIQSAAGAARSAIFGAAFNIMSANVRAAMNHKIQSPGATATKALQRKFWELQPVGVHPWKVRSMQVHDEILVVRTPEMGDAVLKVKDDFLVEYHKKIPLLAIKWDQGMASWAGTH